MNFGQSYALGGVSALIVAAVIVSVSTLGGSTGASCGALFGTANIKADDFYLSNGLQYVLRPGSSGFITINYTNIENSSEVFLESSTYFKPIQYWYRVGDSAGNSTEVTSAEAGLTAFPTYVAVSGPHSIVAVYLVNASITATLGTYQQSFPSVCGPYPLVTIGDSYYSGAYSNLVYP